MEFLRFYSVVSFVLFVTNRVVFSQTNPGDKAPPFRIQTLNGPLIYKNISDTDIKLPIILHEFTNQSGFLEALWTKDSSIIDLLQNSPRNTNYVFMSSTPNARKTAEWMRGRFKGVLEKYYSLIVNLPNGKASKVTETDEMGEKRLLRDDPSFTRKAGMFIPKPHRGIDRRRRTVYDDDTNDVLDGLRFPQGRIKAFRKLNVKDSLILRESSGRSSVPASSKSSKRMFSNRPTVNETDNEFLHELPPHKMANGTGDEFQSLYSKMKGSDRRNNIKKEFIKKWLARLHFVTLPGFQLGNWIPLVASRWYCTGHGCGLDQIAIETEKDGDVSFVSKRLDARYDWLPSPYSLKAKYPRIQIVDYGDGCKEKKGTTASKMAILVSRQGSCSYYDKVATAKKVDALAVIVYSAVNQPLFDMACIDEECSNEVKIPGTMIPHDSGQKILTMLAEDKEVYIRFQHTPTRNFFLAIDEQGKLQEVGWLLYPSMIFLSYQAQWLNYMSGLLNNISHTSSKVIDIFNHTIMEGKKGIVEMIKMPPLEELQRYRSVQLDMSLSCPGDTDFSCPHWDHTVQLFICCGKNSFCGEELARWVTPFRRRIGRWLTQIRPLTPLFTSTNCNFTMKTVPWAMPWKPALQIRLSGKIKEDDVSDTLVPYKIKTLYHGGKFDKNYNKHYKAKEFIVPERVKQVKLYAVISGHGSDNNNCAEFCVTSHHFVINKKFTNTRIFTNAGTPNGCADKIDEGVEPNEHGTWLYGRDGWCDGKDVGPWVQDITDQLELDESINTISYHGYFNGSDPDPTSNPGYIIMHSYLIFYTPAT